MPLLFISFNILELFILDGWPKAGNTPNSTVQKRKLMKIYTQKSKPNISFYIIP